MKPVYAIPFTVVITTAMGQSFDGSAFSALADGDAATFTVGSRAITIGGDDSSTSSADDATVTAAAGPGDFDGDDEDDDSDEDTSSAEAEDDDDFFDQAVSTGGTGNSAFDGFTSSYSGSPITLGYGSSTITLGSLPSAGFGWSYNATATKSVTTTESNGASSTGDDSSGSATATPSGPSTSLGIITDTPRASSTGAVKSVSTVLVLLSAAIAYLV
ncbi:hypothetical protein F4859DRAFT_289286 [Xylaria cf. heliscus]|nr:hypothetical protein F4859DRAFT_289286 [Xylaria cf. heliscus]